MKNATFTTLLLAAVLASTAAAQHAHGGHGQNPDSSTMIGAADAAMNGPMSDAAMKHMLLSPLRKATSSCQ